MTETGQRCALGGVGARAQLVEEHQRTAVADGDNLDNVLHVAGESGQGLLNGLLVADISQHCVEHADKAPVVRRDMQAALRHQGQQADGLQGDRLAAGVGTGDDQGVEVHTQTDGNRHHDVLGQSAGAAPGAGSRCRRCGPLAPCHASGSSGAPWRKSDPAAPASRSPC